MNTKDVYLGQIDAYVSGRLNDDQARAFEEYCLSNPDFARQVEFEQRLKAGIAQVARGDTAEFVRSEPLLRWNLALAAGIVLVLFAGFFIWNRYLPREDPPIMAAVTTDAHRSVASLRLAGVRGSEGTPELPDGRVRVAIAGLFETGHRYSIALDRLDTKRNIDTIASLNDQSPTAPMTLEVMIDGAQLEPGTYSLRIRKQSSSEEALDFEFLKR